MSLAVVKRTVCPRLSACCATFFKIMVLPMPLGPTKTVLCPDLTKFSLKSSSIASRSIFLGQVQSKSTIGFASPTWASRMRRSRPRFWRSRSSMASTSCNHGLSMIWSQQAISPNNPRALRRVFNSAGVNSAVIVFILLECVVGGERVRNDDQIAVLAGRQRNGQGQRQAALGAVPVDHLADGADVDGVALKNLDERVLERLTARSVEELQQAQRVAADVLIALG